MMTQQLLEEMKPLALELDYADEPQTGARTQEAPATETVDETRSKKE
jgi:hypothetical protein